MGGVFAQAKLREALLSGPEAMPDLFHGYTYSGHPLAAAACLATLDVYRDEGIFENAARMAPIFEEMLHGFADAPGVVDVRNIGLMGAIEFTPDGAPGDRGRALYAKLWELGLIVRPIGDSFAMSPPLTITEEIIGRIGELIGEALKD